MVRDLAPLNGKGDKYVASLIRHRRGILAETGSRRGCQAP